MTRAGTEHRTRLQKSIRLHDIVHRLTTQFRRNQHLRFMQITSVIRSLSANLRHLHTELQRWTGKRNLTPAASWAHREQQLLQLRDRWTIRRHASRQALLIFMTVRQLRIPVHLYENNEKLSVRQLANIITPI